MISMRAVLLTFPLVKMKQFFQKAPWVHLTSMLLLILFLGVLFVNLTVLDATGTALQSLALGLGAAATIFFAYVGFDAVSTAAEETKNPQRNVPIGLIGSLGIFRKMEGFTF